VHHVLDILTSGVHDAKNQLFLAESLIVQAEAAHGIKLDEVRFAIEQAASRLSRTLTAYKLRRHAAGALSISMAYLPDLFEEAAIMNRSHCLHLGVTFTFQCPVHQSWLLDQGLVLDMLSNAIQNASRYAKKCVHASAALDQGFLLLRVEDDGPGFAEPDIDQEVKRGIGLSIAKELAYLHENHGKHGHLQLFNGGRLGGAVFEIRLP
jgi:signal transduction histidine kinase